ncbi:class I SAM-dependent methyltransferase [Lentisalinibacter orientalis]|uniref:class I SAM-dependent methyltransferase n=1 Tax=Lentisalinibacter orientalis TaxID=2992241 RepID=UPI00386AC5E5
MNIDWSPLLRLRQHRWATSLASSFLGPDRLRRLRSLPDNIVVHDLRSGIPYRDETVDAVYHSHMLEHLDREDAEAFLREVHRVLKAGGIHRIVVPDMESLAREYLGSLEECRRAVDPELNRSHDTKLGALIEQSVRRTAAGTSGQSAPRRLLETAVFGDARRRGETHQWMYDEITLRQKLADAGYRNPRRVTHRESEIPEWSAIGLDTLGSGEPYKPGSLYIEATK